MTDWKEERIGEYCTLSMDIAKLEQSIREDIEIHVKRITEIAQTRNLDIEEAKRRQGVIKGHLVEHWDIEDKTFKCNAGSATLRTTRSLKIDNKEKLISILQQIGKLAQTITGWDLTYLRKLADAGLFDVDVGGTNIMHYDEKKNVIIRDVKNGRNSENEG